MNRVAYLAGITLFLLVVVGLTLAQNEPTKDHKLTRSEVKALIRSAKTREDHLTLAAYFRDEARKEESTAKYHDEMAELYREHPLPYDGKMPYRMVDHCKYFAENARKAAVTANRMAEEYEKIANGLRNAPNRGGRSFSAGEK